MEPCDRQVSLFTCSVYWDFIILSEIESIEYALEMFAVYHISPIFCRMVGVDKWVEFSLACHHCCIPSCCVQWLHVVDTDSGSAVTALRIYAILLHHRCAMWNLNRYVRLKVEGDSANMGITDHAQVDTFIYFYHYKWGKSSCFAFHMCYWYTWCMQSVAQTSSCNIFIMFSIQHQGLYFSIMYIYSIIALTASTSCTISSVRF
jgi:hypothetical protein